MKYLLFILISLSCFSESYLKDYNGDGVVTILGFGDSLTYGVGDGINPGVEAELPITDGTQGYLKRIRELAGVLTVNGGFPGQVFTDGGFKRFPRTLANSRADIVVIFDGNNDAGFQVTAKDFRSKMQTIINISAIYGAKVVLVTLPQTCCDHAGRTPFIDSLNSVLYSQNSLNNLRVADISRSWRTTCSSLNKCDLFNLPEGLHPNKRGYRVIAEVILASIYGIDLFSSNGAGELADALGISSADIITKPGA